MDSEADLDMTEAWPPVPPATREPPAAKPGTGAEGSAEGDPSTPSVSPGRIEFGGINGSSCSNSSSSSDDSRTNSDTSNSNDSGDLSALVGRSAWELQVFGELPALQSGSTKFQSWGLTMSSSYVDALLAYAIRTMEAKRTVEERPQKSNELTIHSWKSAWRRSVNDPMSSRGVVRCCNSARRSRTRTVHSQWRSNNNLS